MEFNLNLSSPGVKIVAKNIEMGERVSFGPNIDIKVKGTFRLGDRSHLGSNVRIRGRDVYLGADLYHSEGLDVGGGGCDMPWSVLAVGDRCTMHNSHLNIYKPITIGDDVGLSPNVDILTHGFWLSALDGFPVKFASVVIEHGAIIGRGTTILPGVRVGVEAVVGAGSIVTRNVPALTIYAGNPAKFIRDVMPISGEAQRTIFDRILVEYEEICAYHQISPNIHAHFPVIEINEWGCDVVTMKCWGTEDEHSDSLRDHLRRWGIRFYTQRPFRSALKW